MSIRHRVLQVYYRSSDGESRLRDEKLGINGRQVFADTLLYVPEDDDELNAEEQETLEETLVDDATAAKLIVELESEIEIPKGLEKQARDLVTSGQDRKRGLSKIQSMGEREAHSASDSTKRTV